MHAELQSGCNLSDTADWRSTWRVGLITQRSVDRNHLLFDMSLRARDSQCAKGSAATSYTHALYTIRAIAELPSGCNLSDTAEWRSGWRVGLITQRSVDRNHLLFDMSLRARDSKCAKGSDATSYTNALYTIRAMTELRQITVRSEAQDCVSPLRGITQTTDSVLNDHDHCLYKGRQPEVVRTSRCGQDGKAKSKQGTRLLREMGHNQKAKSNKHPV